MSLEFRTATLDELAGAVDVVSTAFLDRPDLERLATSVRETWDLDRTWIARDGDLTCGVWRSWATEITVPGGVQLPAAAVGPVTVLPTHRRRGAFKGMTAGAHAGIRDMGDAMALLNASEWGIYGRYGYGPATRRVDWTIRTVPAGGVHGTPAGTVELVAPAKARDILGPIFEAWRVRQPGEIQRRDLTWELDLGLRMVPWSGETWKGWVAVHRSTDGTPDGYARYTAKEKDDGSHPIGVAGVEELIALDDAAHADLLRYLTEIDLVREVVLKSRRDTDRSRWMLRDPRAASASNGWDAVWVRLFDLPRSLAARRYEREGRLVLEVIDDELPGGRARVALDASTDGATAVATDALPDLTVQVSALGAAYLGGTRLRDVTLATGADEHRPGSLALADGLLRTADEPVCSTFF